VKYYKQIFIIVY